MTSRLSHIWLIQSVFCLFLAVRYTKVGLSTEPILKNENGLMTEVYTHGCNLILTLAFAMGTSLFGIWSFALSSAQSTVSPTVSSEPDSSVIALIVLSSILVGVGGLLCIGGVCFCCYNKCKDGCYV